jgi:hypothetical protein
MIAFYSHLLKAFPAVRLGHVAFQFDLLKKIAGSLLQNDTVRMITTTKNKEPINLNGTYEPGCLVEITEC